MRPSTDCLTDVTKALGLAVAIVVLEVLFLLSAVVPSQLKKTLSVGDGLVVLALGEGLVARVAKEVKVEASLGVLKGAEARHAKDFLVFKQWHIEVTNHGVSRHVSLLHVLGLLVVVSGDDLDPVTIRVKDESNVSHAAIGKLLLELVTSIFNSLAGGLDVVDRDTGVAKATMRILVTIVHLIFRVILSAVVGIGRVVAKEVEIKLVIREFELLDKAHSQELIEFSYIGVK
ncbi:hypothetical protein HG531_010114 [Fusarium graminearum]|nr:hypothetical protein HG531_010114 [Fusarium graminearum]